MGLLRMAKTRHPSIARKLGRRVSRVIFQVGIKHEVEQAGHLVVAHRPRLVVMGRAQHAGLSIPREPVEHEEMRPIDLVQRLHHAPCARAAGIERKVHGQHLAGVRVRLLQRVVEMQRVRQRIARHGNPRGKVAHQSTTG